ncbi:hypothetical protein [Acidocella facilis]|uniref:hypothetical protein n=1 Tax=Acidocella facilis TaxID=525 RepID=UPI001F29BD95|nr:hypothetical protein [Acidocella facilis]
MMNAAILPSKTLEPHQKAVSRLNQLQFFGTASSLIELLQKGWAPSEDNHNWNDGPEASLLLKLDRIPTQTCTISVEGAAFIHQRAPRQAITLYANGWRLNSWLLKDAGKTMLEAIIEPEQWFARGDIAQLNLHWHMPDCTSPKDIGLGSDERQLAFCFMSITVTAA